MSCNYCNKRPKWTIFPFSFNSRVLYFDLQNSNLMSVSVSRNQRLSIDNLEKQRNFPDYWGFQNQINKKKLMWLNYWSIIMLHYLLPQNGWSWSNFPDQSEGLGGAIVPIASSVGRSEGPRALSGFHRRLHQESPATVPDTSDNLEKCFFGLSRCWGHGDENGHWIWILHVKIQYIDNFFLKTFILDVFNLFSVTVIAWYLEILTLKFQDSGNFPDWWDTTLGFFDLPNLNPVSIFANRHRKPPIISKFKVFQNNRGFPVLADENGHRIYILQVKIHKFKEKIPLFRWRTISTTEMEKHKMSESVNDR